MPGYVEDKFLEMQEMDEAGKQMQSDNAMAEAEAQEQVQIIKQPCGYPKCKAEGLYPWQFELVNEENANVQLLFCPYHHVIVMGGHFKAKIIPATINLLGEFKEYDFELIGPMKEIEIAEIVMAAREMTSAAAEKPKI